MTYFKDDIINDISKFKNNDKNFNNITVNEIITNMKKNINEELEFKKILKAYFKHAVKKVIFNNNLFNRKLKPFKNLILPLNLIKKNFVHPMPTDKVLSENSANSLNLITSNSASAYGYALQIKLFQKKKQELLRSKIYNKNNNIPFYTEINEELIKLKQIRTLDYI